MMKENEKVVEGGGKVVKENEEILNPAILRAVLAGDFSKLSESERQQYYLAVCKSLGLDYALRPFEYLRLGGRLVLYATKAAADQLRRIHGVTISIVSQGQVGDLYVVHVRARARDGREDEDIGAVSIAGLRGDDLVNAIMKAVTKAKRRVTLSLCGVGLLDETEIDTIPGAERVDEDSDMPESSPVDLAGRLTEKQRAYYFDLCQRFDIDPLALLEARGVSSAQQASNLIDLLRTANKPFNDPDQASRALTALCTRYGVSAPEVARMLEQQFGWDGDLGKLIRGWTMWLEAELYRRQRDQASAEPGDQDDDYEVAVA